MVEYCLDTAQQLQEKLKQKVDITSLSLSYTNDRNAQYISLLSIPGGSLAEQGWHKRNQPKIMEVGLWVFNFFIVNHLFDNLNLIKKI